MNNKNFKIIGMVFIFAILVLAVAAAGCTTTQTSTATVTPVPSTTTKTITDMMGRTVVIPDKIDRVVTAFSTAPPQNSFIMAIGESDTIAYGLPAWAVADGRHKYQYVFAPQIATAPDVEDVETLLQVNPDVVFTMSKPTVTQLENRSIPVVYLQCNVPEDNKQIMVLMGEIFNKPERAAEYAQYFDAKIAEINRTVASVPVDQRPKVLSVRQSMTVMKSSEWWITEAGGIAVSKDNGTATGNYQFDMEQLLKWNPDVIIGWNESFKDVYNDSRFSDISAVKNHRIYVTPSGAHDWGAVTSESPLMVEWAASKFYPELISEDKVIADTTSFYKQFFGVTLTRDQVIEILNGTAT